MIAEPETPFRRVYYCTPPKYALENLKNQRLKLSRFDNVNDPFELEAIDFSDGELRKNYRTMREKLFDNKFGFLSFSRSWRNSIMWSHYADRHTGLCLGFRVRSENYFDVRYSSERLYHGIRWKTFLDHVGEEQMPDLMGTKHSHWSYEEEVRVLHKLDTVGQEGTLYFVPFDENFRLETIYLGPDTYWGLEDVREVLGDARAEVVGTRRAFREFRVVRQKEKTLWKQRA